MGKKFEAKNTVISENRIQYFLLFSFKPPPVIEARTHLQLGNILQSLTTNHDLAKHHLEQAWFLAQNIQQFDDVKFEAAIVLAK